MGVIAEKFADEKGLVWPENIAPYRYYLAPIGDTGAKIAAELEAEYPEEIMLDDRAIRPGEKFADAELMGIPYRIVISDKTLGIQDQGDGSAPDITQNGKVEITNRQTGETKLLTISELKGILNSL